MTAWTLALLGTAVTAVLVADAIEPFTREPMTFRARLSVAATVLAAVGFLLFAQRVGAR